jgi:malonate-semialdehyde dehydrogenase (acetylating)/methylmalonate-semialdehyde dehydrogenase
VSDASRQASNAFAAACTAASTSAGERCMAISAVVAVGDAGDALVANLKQKASEITVGPGRDSKSEMGPVVTPEARDRIVGYVDRGEQAGATLVVDGRGLVIDNHEDGFFVGPCLFDHVTTDMDIYTDEIFGPVLVVLRAETFDEALDIVNANPYGNGTAIFTSSGQAARKFQRQVQVGMIGINVPIPVPMAFYSFGGWKDSLFGDTHVHGPEGIRFYTRAKAITSRWPDSGYQEHHRSHMQFPTAT